MNDIVYAGKHFLTFSVSRHKHPTWELIYCTSKSGVMVFDSMQLPYAEGDIVVIPPNIPHLNVSENGFTNIHLNIADSTLAFRQPAVMQDDANGSILHLFSDAYYLYCGDSAHKAELLASYGNLLAQYMASGAHASAKNRITEQIEQSIVHNYANADYQLDEALRGMPYCYDYLARVFRRDTGVTPHKYLTNLRLQSAAAMLQSDYRSITEVALLCGFRNPLYFSRLFKKKYGVSPKEYCNGRAFGSPEESGNHRIILPEEAF